MLSKLGEALGLNKHKAHMRRWRESALRIGQQEPQLEAFSDEALAGAIKEHRLACAQSTEVALGRRDDHLERSFALAREAAKRSLGMRYFDVQLFGAMALHEGKLAEMKTGEGKSLCLTLAAIHNALRGLQTHVVTVNEYLARRDAEAMQPLYAWFGLAVGLLRDGQGLEERRGQYASDIVYGVNHEFGFDYLRHNMARSSSERRMVRGLGFAIVDEVDSILIDEARTPLIISGNENDDLSVYAHCWQAACMLDKKTELEVDERQRSVIVSDAGFERLEDFFIERGLIGHGHHLYEMENNALLRALQASLSARFLFHRDKHYIVSEGKVLIVDENTGRLMADRRWSNGIHQAMEAKEGVEVMQESKTMATITYQNFFNLYGKLSGLTGTAMTQQGEFWQIYGLEAISIPTHMPMIRIDQADMVYRSEREKFEVLAKEAQKAVAMGRPVLAGTSNIEESEKLSAELEKLGVEHRLLNAKNHELEAQIIEDAGRPKSVTVATNMAGRGTDIVLGGNWSALERRARDEGHGEDEVADRKKQWLADRASVAQAGGLLVLGCARNESRRVDNQLRGRSGRQGDPGESRFFISLDDDLFRVYAQNGVLAMIDKYNMLPEGSCLEHPMLNRSLDKAQAAVENHHFDMRKQLLDYDGVGSHQRKSVYAWRDEIIEADDEKIWNMSMEMVEQAVEDVAASWGDSRFVEAWESKHAQETLALIAPLPMDFASWGDKAIDGSEIQSRLVEHWTGPIQEARRMGWGSSEGLRSLMLERIDDAWQDHLTILQNLLDGIHLRSYAQKDPKQEYKREGYEMFARLRGAVVAQVSNALLGWTGGARARAEQAAEMMDKSVAEPIFPPTEQAQAEADEAIHWLDARREAEKEFWGDLLWISPNQLASVELKKIAVAEPPDDELVQTRVNERTDAERNEAILLSRP